MSRINAVLLAFLLLFVHSFAVAQTPSVVGATTTGADRYSVQVYGTQFAADAYVDARAGTGGPIIASFSGAQLTRTTSSGYTYLTFYVSDTTIRNQLNAGGLYLWVVNPSVPAWHGPARVVRVPPANQAPTVSLFANMTSAPAPATVTLTASASDPDGSITKVEFYRGTTIIAVDTAAPFVQTHPITTAGTHTFTARAYDNAGASTVSTPLTVTVTAAPAFALTSGTTTGADKYTIQLTGSGFASDANVDVRSGTGGPILASFSGAQLTRGGTTTLSFYVSDASLRNLLGTSGLYFWVVNPSQGAWVGPVRVIRTAPANQPPGVSLSVSPTTGLVAPATVTLTASASDPDGSITKVEFLLNGSLVGTYYAASAAHTLSGLAAGSYILTARAYDNAGAMATSATTQITVTGTPNAASYDTTAADIVVSSTSVLLSRTINITTPIDLFVQSDGSLRPGTGTNRPAAQFKLYVNGIGVSNTARIDYHGAMARDTHTYNLIGNISLQPGSHVVELRATATGGTVRVIAGSNLVTMPMKSGALLGSTTTLNQGPFAFTTKPIAAGPRDDRSSNPEPLPYQEVLRQSRPTTAGEPITVLTSGTIYQNGHDGDPLVGLWFNGIQTNMYAGSWSINDLCECSELVSPFATHARHVATGSTSTMVLGASEFYWSDQNDENPIRYNVASDSRLLSIRGTAVDGLGTPPMPGYAPTSMLNTLPTRGVDRVLSSGTISIPAGHNGEVLIAGKTRLFGGDGRGTASLWLRIDGQRFGSVSLQDCGFSHSFGCVSARTLTTSFLTAGAHRLAPGNHTVELIGRFDSQTANDEHYMSYDGALIWFDAPK